MRLGSYVAVVVVQADGAAAPIRPLAWEPPYSVTVALNSKVNQSINNFLGIEWYTVSVISKGYVPGTQATDL